MEENIEKNIELTTMKRQNSDAFVTQEFRCFHVYRPVSRPLTKADHFKKKTTQRPKPRHGQVTYFCPELVQFWVGIDGNPKNLLLF